MCVSFYCSEVEDEEDYPYETIPELQVPKGVNLVSVKY